MPPSLVTPVDYKAGSPREGPDGCELWDTDKMQLGLARSLFCRDNGYVCDEGVIFYRGTKQRVRLPMTPALEILDHGSHYAARASDGPLAPFRHPWRDHPNAFVVPWRPSACRMKPAPLAERCGSVARRRSDGLRQTRRQKRKPPVSNPPSVASSPHATHARALYLNTPRHPGWGAMPESWW